MCLSVYVQVCLRLSTGKRFDNWALSPNAAFPPPTHFQFTVKQTRIFFILLSLSLYLSLSLSFSFFYFFLSGRSRCTTFDFESVIVQQIFLLVIDKMLIWVLVWVVQFILFIKRIENNTCWFLFSFGWKFSVFWSIAEKGGKTNHSFSNNRQYLHASQV